MLHKDSAAVMIGVVAVIACGYTLRRQLWQAPQSSVRRRHHWRLRTMSSSTPVHSSAHKPPPVHDRHKHDDYDVVQTVSQCRRPRFSINFSVDYTDVLIKSPRRGVVVSGVRRMNRGENDFNLHIIQDSCSWSDDKTYDTR